MVDGKQDKNDKYSTFVRLDCIVDKKTFFLIIRSYTNILMFIFKSTIFRSVTLAQIYITPSVSQRLSYFDRTRILRNVMKNELKKLVKYESYFYILLL